MTGSRPLGGDGFSNARGSVGALVAVGLDTAAQPAFAPSSFDRPAPTVSDRPRGGEPPARAPFFRDWF